MGLDLRTGKPVWLLDETEAPKHAPLSKNIETEVLIIGGGITGALIANALVKEGLEVVLVDKREIGAGSTSASTAILSYELDTPLDELIDRVGVKSAKRILELGVEAIAELEKLAKRFPGASRFEKKNSIYFASTEGDAEDIKKEYALRKSFGLDVELWDTEVCKKNLPFETRAAILSRDAAIVNPVLLTRALLAEAEASGLRIYSQTKAKSYEIINDEKIVTTESGQKIRARHVIFASGYESQEFLKQRDVALHSSYALSTKPVSSFTGWPGQESIWESARPYVYLRTTKDKRIIIGGEDVDFVDEDLRDQLLPEKTKILEERLRKMFPDISFEAETAWTGTFAESRDGLPYIGENAKFPGAYFALGYGGNGTVFAAIASKIILDLVKSVPNADAEIFSFKRGRYSWGKVMLALKNLLK